MSYSYVFMVLDDHGDSILERDLTVEQSVDLMAVLLAGEPEREVASKESSKKETVKTTGKKYKKRVCSICSESGHDVRKCPKGKGMHPDNPRDEQMRPKESISTDDKRALKIKEMLANGHDDDFIASELLTSPRIVAFIRKQQQV